MNQLRLDLLNRVASILASISIMSLPMLVSVSPVYGFTEAQLQGQVSQISSEIANQSVEIHNLAVNEVRAEQNLANDNARLSLATRGLAVDQVRLGRSEKILREIALDEFTHETGASSFIRILSTSQAEYATRLEFEKAMGLDVSTAILTYRVALAGEQGQLSVIASSRAAAEQEKAQLDLSKSGLESTVAHEQGLLRSLNSQIAVQVQQQMAARIRDQLRARNLVTQSNNSSQGLPSSSGISSVARNGAGISNWGGRPAPPSPAALSALRQCESGGNYSDNTGNGYYGAYQFSISTWQHLGFPGVPSESPPQVQDRAASLLARGGWYSWPECALVLGLN